MKLLVVKKELLTRGKDEIFSAIDTPEYLVLEFHDPVVCRFCKAATSRLLEKSELNWPGHRSGLLQLHVGEENWRRRERHCHVLHKP